MRDETRTILDRVHIPLIEKRVVIACPILKRRINAAIAEIQAQKWGAWYQDLYNAQCANFSEEVKRIAYVKAQKEKDRKEKIQEVRRK